MKEIHIALIATALECAYSRVENLVASGLDEHTAMRRAHMERVLGAYNHWPKRDLVVFLRELTVNKQDEFGGRVVNLDKI